MLLEKLLNHYLLVGYLSAIKSRYQHEIINKCYILLNFKITINKYNLKT